MPIGACSVAAQPDSTHHVTSLQPRRTARVSHNDTVQLEYCRDEKEVYTLNRRQQVARPAAVASRACRRLPPPALALRRPQELGAGVHEQCQLSQRTIGGGLSHSHQQYILYIRRNYTLHVTR